MSVEEYRANAQECFDWARTAKSERERAIFIEMAQTWLVAASQYQRRNGGSNSTPADQGPQP
jgi:hypothetical protein